MLKKRPLLEAPEWVIEKALSIIPEKKEVYERFYFNWGIALWIFCVAVAWAVTGVTIYFGPGVGFIDLLVQKIYGMITGWSLVVRSPYFIWGVVIYSIVFSISSPLLFWRSQIREERLLRI